MLQSLSVNNLGLIDTLEIEFSPGLNILTGPTGSGKSMLIEALSLALGARADFDLLHSDETRAETSIFFNDVSVSDSVEFLSDEIDGEFTCRRILTPERTSKGYVNGSRVRLKEMRNLRSNLIDFHGQHEEQVVFQSEYPRKVLDAFGEFDDLLAEYRELYTEYGDVQREIDELSGADSEFEQRKQLLEYQVREIDQFEPGETEWTEIEDQRRQLESIESVEEKLREIIGILTAESSPVDQLTRISENLQGISASVEDVDNWIDELESTTVQIEEFRRWIQEKKEALDETEITYDELMDRRGRWLELSRKHEVSPEQFYDHYQELKNELKTIERRKDRLKELKNKISDLEDTLKGVGADIHECRSEVADVLETEIESQLEKLNLEQSRFVIEVTSDSIGPHGCDSVNWLFTSHTSREPDLLAERVSGGEISRVLLALKSVLAEADQTPILVFDEIDTGVSGEEAYQIGNLLKDLSNSHQVICITHLPLVAAQADRHILVERRNMQDRVEISADILSHDERVEEISRLLSGDEESDVSNEQARELLGTYN